MKSKWNVWKSVKAWKPRKKLITGITALVLCIVIIVVSVAIVGSYSGEVIYRETKVVKGDLVVGVEESGTVDIGTVEQVFELDMSALQRAATGTSDSSSDSIGMSTGQSGGMSSGGMPSMGGGQSSSGSSGSRSSGGLDMFSQIFNMAGSDNTTNSGSDSSLTVANVCVSVGQQIAEGDVLYELEEESVVELQEELQSNVEKAKADLDAVYADQTLSKQTAKYTYDTSVAYGDYASVEYSNSILELEDAVTSAQKTLTQAQNSLTDYKEQLEETTTLYHNAVKVLQECEWARDNTNKGTETYNYVTYFQMAETAEATVNSLKQKKEQLESNVEQAATNVKSAQKEVQNANRNLNQGKLSAKETLALRQLAYSTAQETYDIALAYLEEDAAEQEATYQETVDKWDEYSSHIDGYNVCSQYNGVITSVDLSEGDSINTNSVLITLYDLNDVSMTVTVKESDMTDIAKGTLANISFTAYPDTVFQAKVTEISDATTDSDGNVTYDVTVTLEGDVSGLFQGMTGDITFITKEIKEVLYVSNRAVTRKGTGSYVKVKETDGKIVSKKIETGFSDGVNVEIVEGLSEDDVVLIESKVSVE